MSKITSVDAGSPNPPPRKEYNKVNLPTRGSYTPTNAEQFREVFDEMIVNNKPKEIHSDMVNLKPSTLYIKANDALKWLAECDLKRGGDYASLRSRVAITRTEYGILIYFKASINQISRAAMTAETNKGWKEELTIWLQSAQPMEIFAREGILISPEDKEWLTSIATQLGEDVELELQTNGFRLMR